MWEKWSTTRVFVAGFRAGRAGSDDTRGETTTIFPFLICQDLARPTSSTEIYRFTFFIIARGVHQSNSSNQLKTDHHHRTHSHRTDNMKAVIVREHGTAETALSIESDWPKPTAKPGQILIQNTYSGLNFIDTYYRNGLYKQELPFCAGQEGGGVIVEIPPETTDSTDLKVGDVVVYMTFGSYAEYTAVPVEKAIKVPVGMDLQVAVACMVQGLTAHYLTTDATCGLIKPQEWCLIYSSGSGTCQWAAQMARLQGYKVIGTTSKTKETQARAVCNELIVLDTAAGKTHADYASVNIVDRVQQITQNQGVKLILDGVGKSTIDVSIACLSRRGMFVSFGNASGAVPPFSLLRLTPKSAFCTRPKLGDYVATREELQKRCDDVFGWVRDGKLNVTVDKVFPLEEAAEGHLYLESGQSKGKILYKI